MPVADIPLNNLPDSSTITLADCQLNISGSVDLLLCVALFPYILKGNVRHFAYANSLTTIDSIFE